MKKVTNVQYVVDAIFNKYAGGFYQLVNGNMYKMTVKQRNAIKNS